jgi:serine protease AprX
MSEDAPIGGSMHNTDDRRDPTGFDPEVLDSAVIALPLKKLLEEHPDEPHHVVIDVNFNYHEGVDGAKQRVLSLIEEASSGHTGTTVGESWSGSSQRTQYVYATLSAPAVKEIVRLDRESATEQSQKYRAIFHIWPDFEIKAFA